LKNINHSIKTNGSQITNHSIKTSVKIDHAVSVVRDHIFQTSNFVTLGLVDSAQRILEVVTLVERRLHNSEERSLELENHHLIAFGIIEPLGTLM
jgi:protein-arginine kinase